MRVYSIREPSYVDGPGKRIVVHTSGCRLRCLGCQNDHLWSGEEGGDVTPLTLANMLYASALPVTITGGEPFDQPRDLALTLMALRELDPDRHIIVYTGYTFLELVRTGDWYTLAAIASADVLVDGRYVPELDAPDLQYRGSSNQRAIDVQATLRRPVGLTFSQGPVTLDWDTAEIVLTAEGDLLAASGVAREFTQVGAAEGTRRCGEADA